MRSSYRLIVSAFTVVSLFTLLMPGPLDASGRTLGAVPLPAAQADASAFHSDGYTSLAGTRGSEAPAATMRAAPALSASNVITLTAAGFQPAVLTIPFGADVTWLNTTSDTQTLVSGEPLRLFLPLVMRPGAAQVAASSPDAGSIPQNLSGSGLFAATLPPGGSFTYTFYTAGAVPYFLANAPQFSGRVIVEADLPPDPATIAPPLDPTVPTDMGDATKFLYTGPNPVQTGVVSGTIETRRVAVLRGRVLTSAQQPLSNVTVTVLDHPEYALTRTRPDGMFDLAVNGGGRLTLNYAVIGHLSAQRAIDVPWLDYVQLPDVVMLQEDPHTSLIDLAAAIPMQVARGSVVSDTDGIRQQTLFFPQGTAAYLSFTNGVTQTITTLHVRATEYTVGPNGEQAMPAELPPNSAYTYASIFHADEAVAAGAQDVWFNPPILSYVENFLNFATGAPVPMGHYDPRQGVWVASDSGRVIKILSATGGMADLDLDGSNTPATPAALAALDITDAERAKLAELYAAGQSLWRVPVPHFDRPWDQNQNTKCGAEPCDPPPNLSPQTSTANPNHQCGSIIECQNQALGETVDVVGTPFNLRYQSSRTPGYLAARSLHIPVSGATVSPNLKRIELTVFVAGQRLVSQVFQHPSPNQSYDFIWDGKDGYGRTIQGPARVSVGLDYIYPLVYQYTDRFGYNGDGAVALSASQQRAEFRMHRAWYGLISTWQPPAFDLGGWTLNVHHTYDPRGKVLYLGSGGQRSVNSLNVDIVETVAGGGSCGGFSCGDGGPATRAALNNPTGVAVGPDGSIYISTAKWDASSTDNRLRKIDPQGIITTIAGGNSMCGPSDPCGDGGPALQARLGQPSGVAVGPDGSLYMADSRLNRVRKIDPSGIITTVAGTGSSCYLPTDPTCGDGGPATQARINMPVDVAVAPDGSLYFAESANYVGGWGRIRRVGTDGLISTVAGGGGEGPVPMAARRLKSSSPIHTGSPSVRVAACTSQNQRRGARVPVSSAGLDRMASSAPSLVVPLDGRSPMEMVARRPMHICPTRPRSPLVRMAACISPWAVRCTRLR